MATFMQDKKLNRRQFVKLAGLAAGAALTGCAPQNPFDQLYPQSGSWPAETPEPTWRTLNRVTFGPRAEERRRVTEIGLAAFIEEQLAPETLDEVDTGPMLTLRRLESLQFDVSTIFDLPEETATGQLQQAALLRAVYSRRQLYEIMVEFWSNHFNIAQTKGDCAWLKTIDDREVIRPHALGNFRELLLASAHSPAMLVYLDNQENLAGNPNENYARELLELHTLGINGGYTQRDVQELARCLTGWTVKEHFYRGQFTFDPNQHDNGPKRILGMDIPAGAGQAGAEQLLDMLAHHPATAHFIATKLVRRFIADDPPPDLVQQAAQTFLNTQGDIKAVLRTILLSAHFLTPTIPDLSLSLSLKLKRPLEFIASALRQLNAQTDAGPPLLQYLAEMGQPLFQWPTPDGFPDYAAAWNGSLMTRWRFALALVSDEIAGTVIDWAALSQPIGEASLETGLKQFATLLLGRSLPDSLASELPSDEKTLLATLLGSPTFQWK
jgi:hypothetical protein